MVSKANGEKQKVCYSINIFGGGGVYYIFGQCRSKIRQHVLFSLLIYTILKRFPNSDSCLSFYGSKLVSGNNENSKWPICVGFVQDDLELLLHDNFTDVILDTAT